MSRTINTYCEGTLGGICRSAEALRPSSNSRVLHNMDAYLLGEPIPVRIVLMMFHNQHYHQVPTLQQALELENLMATRALILHEPNNFRIVAEQVQRIIRNIANNHLHFEMAQASLNW